MKAQRLILEGDALRYKGDWVTNTAYNINDVVTWATDGHLYEVIKAHTSSDAIIPSDTTYYKAMTARKTDHVVYTNNSESVKSAINFINSLVSSGVPITISITDNTSANVKRIMTPVILSANKVTLSCTEYDSLDEVAKIYQATLEGGSASLDYLKITNNGTTAQVSLSVSSIEVWYLK